MDAYTPQEVMELAHDMVHTGPQYARRRLALGMELAQARQTLIDRLAKGAAIVRKDASRLDLLLDLIDALAAADKALRSVDADETRIKFVEVYWNAEIDPNAKRPSETHH